MSASCTLRVAAVRKQNPRGFGGAIFTGKPIDGHGNVVDAGAYVVVRASGAVLAGVTVEKGQWWEVVGAVSSRTVEFNGYRVIEQQVEAKSATMLRPSGEHIVTFMAESAVFEGIGMVKARRLWESFGERLYDILERADVDTLSTVLTADIARKAVIAWRTHGDARTLQWLQAQGFDVALGRKVVEFFGAEAPERIEEDPYRLLSFCASWRQVDALARSRFGVAADDPRRLQGAVEEACYQLFTAGHTAALSSTLMATLEPILGAQTSSFKWRGLISTALSHGLSNGSFVVGHHGVQPLGAMVMEAIVARALADRVRQGALAQLLSQVEIDAALADHEAFEGLTLNKEQRLAIHTACAHPFACITGAAGVGKTTVLKALYEVYDRAGLRIVQLALAGRAAKRMQEATGREASTIASFIRSYKDGDLGSPAVLVVDEASMVDIIAMNRICEAMPSHVRLVLVGDPNQLMPVGPGLVLHAVASVPEVPVVELKVVKRHGDEIRQAAASIRDGKWQALIADDRAAIAFVPCGTDETTIAEAVLAFYRQDPANTQILSSRRSGAGGTKGLNSLCQSRLSSARKALMTWNDEHDCDEHTGIHLGDTVLCTRNLWDRGLQNGSLGTVVQIEDEPHPLADDEGSGADRALAWVEWDDGVRRPLLEDMLDDLELGYAITVHKAQGSQWPRVIVAVTGSRLLDRTLLYTAVTRAQRQVILVGDEAAARDAVARPPRAHTRQVALDLTLQRLLLAPPESDAETVNSAAIQPELLT